MDIALKKIFSLLQKLSCNDHSCGCSVSDLIFLCLGDLNKHLGSRMLDRHLFKNRNPVIRYNNVPQRINKHLVHAFWA